MIAGCPRDAWHECAPDLAQWAMDRLVNQPDAYGAYSSPENRGQINPRTQREIPHSYASKCELTINTLQRHFRTGLGVNESTHPCQAAAFETTYSNVPSTNSVRNKPMSSAQL